MYNNYYVTLLNRAEHTLGYLALFFKFFIFFFLFNGPWWIRRSIPGSLCSWQERDGLDARVVSVYHLYIIDQYRRGQQLVLNICILKKAKRRKATVRRINSYGSFVFFFVLFQLFFFFNKNCEKLYTIFTIIIWQDHRRTFLCDRTSVWTDSSLAKTPPAPKRLQDVTVLHFKGVRDRKVQNAFAPLSSNDGWEGGSKLY